MEWLPYKQYDLTVFKTRKSWFYSPATVQQLVSLSQLINLIC